MHRSPSVGKGHAGADQSSRSSNSSGAGLRLRRLSSLRARASRALDAHRHVCVWSAGNRRSLSSRTEEPAEVKLARLDERRRRDLRVEAVVPNDETTSAAGSDVGRPLYVAIPRSSSGCPIARLLRGDFAAPPPAPALSPAEAAGDTPGSSGDHTGSGEFHLRPKGL